MGLSGIRLALVTALIGSVGYGLIFGIVKARRAYNSYNLNQTLYTAALHGNTEHVVQLITDGADVNYAGEGYTPLMVAAQSKHSDTVAALIARGADVNGHDPTGRTPLMVAVGTGSAGVVRYLIDRHANVNAKDNTGITALALAKGQRFERLVEMLQRAGARE